MLKYGINDLRAFFDCDYRWLTLIDPLDVPTNYRGLQMKITFDWLKDHLKTNLKKNLWSN